MLLYEVFLQLDEIHFPVFPWTHYQWEGFVKYRTHFWDSWDFDLLCF